MVSTLEPSPTDTVNVLLEKILRLANELNGGPAVQPDYFPEGSTPLRGDTINVALQKICGSLYELSISGTGSPMGGFSGIGSPEGVVAATVPSIYFDITTPSSPQIWWKTSGSGNTGWTS